MKEGTREEGREGRQTTRRRDGRREGRRKEGGKKERRREMKRGEERGKGRREDILGFLQICLTDFEEIQNKLAV